MVLFIPYFTKYIAMKKLYFIFLVLGLSFSAKAQDLSKTMTVKEGGLVSISQGMTMFSASEVNLKSTSNSFSSLFLDGPLDASTIVNYDRYVNVIGVLGVPGGNDLISLPVKKAGNVTFGEFINYSNGSNVNSTVIPHSTAVTSLYAFGPYSNTTGGYTNYNLATDANLPLTRGKGYRTASYPVLLDGKISGQTVRFTGTVSTSQETVEISTINKNNWNTVGNPYPTFIDSKEFLLGNLAVLNPYALAIYGYNSNTNGHGPGTIGNFTIINLNTLQNINIAPGQGFLVSNNPINPTHQVTFTQDMRTDVTNDDFILGRNDSDNNSENYKLRLRAVSETANFATEFYFNSNSTSGLDPGYDAVLFGGTTYDFMLYSQLVEGSLDQKMAIQSLGLAAMNDINISLGMKCSIGKKITFSIEESTLPAGAKVYLEDRKTNSFTLLNTDNYTFTSDVALSGVGRFFLRLENQMLSTNDLEKTDFQIFTAEKEIYINGEILADTNVSIYDIQGRLVMTSFLLEASQKNKVDVNTLSRGIYVVTLKNLKQFQTKKIIIK